MLGLVRDSIVHDHVPYRTKMWHVNGERNTRAPPVCQRSCIVNTIVECVASSNIVIR